MPEPVTPEAFKAAKPQFFDQPDGTIQAYLDLAALWVDDSWPDTFYRPAIIAATCHMMTLDGLGTDAESQSFKEGGAQFQSIKTGNVTLTRYASRAEGAGQSFFGWLGSTACGRFLVQLMRRRYGGPLVAMGGISPAGASGYAKDWPRIFWGS